jgi:hypothetical protein
MDTSVHFEKIAEEITKYLEAADHDIVVAIAWFTDRSLFNILLRKASSGIAVKLLYLDDKINNNAPFNIRQLEAHKAQLFPITSDMQTNNIMHNKFCVVDGRHAITGSYNWTNRAKSNDENITIFSDAPEIASRFLKEFDDMLEKYNYKKSTNISPQSIIPRLEVVKNFVLMEEWGAAQAQLEKLRSFEEMWALKSLFSAIEKQDSQAVTGWVAAFIKDNMALVIHENEDIPRLKIELRMFEFRVVALSGEKDDLEKQISDFHQKTNLNLGELTARYLKLQAALKQKLAEAMEAEPSKKEQTRTEAKQAKEEYEEYQKGVEDFRQQPLPPELSDTDQKQLKGLFKKASQLCHPDKVSDDQREIATKRFIQLKAAYDQNDLEAVRMIHDDLINNRPYTDNADTMSDSQLMKQEIKRLKSTSDSLLVEILALKTQLSDLGIDGIVDWGEYFTSQKQSLMDAIERLEIELPHA